MSNPTFVFMDIETTGLDPDYHELLEIGAVVTDENFQPVQDVENFFRAFCAPRTPLNSWAPEAVKMHVENGLILDSVMAGAPARDSAARFASWLSGFAGPNTFLAGSSVHFDVSFLSRFHEVALAFANCNHRRLDVSAIRIIDNLTGVGLIPKPKQGVKHRVLDDVWHDIDQARKILKHWGRQ